MLNLVLDTPGILKDDFINGSIGMLFTVHLFWYCLQKVWEDKNLKFKCALQPFTIFYTKLETEKFFGSSYWKFIYQDLTSKIGQTIARHPLNLTPDLPEGHRKICDFLLKTCPGPMCEINLYSSIYDKEATIEANFIGSPKLK